MSTAIEGDYQFIDVIAILEQGARSGLITRFDRTVSKTYAGWEIQLPGVQGVFELLLRDHQPEGLSVERGTVAHYFRTDFLLKYYPDPGEDVFPTFSLYERILRESGVFDDGPAPKTEIKQEIHESYFTIAEVALVKARDQRAVALSLRSQDQWREVRGSPLRVRDETGRIRRLAVGSVDRQVPGWTIGMKFFLPLVKAYALRCGKPQTMRLSETRGRVWRVTKKRAVSRLSRRVTEKRLDIGFLSTRDRRARHDLRLYLARSFGGKEPLRERSLRSIKSLERIA